MNTQLEEIYLQQIVPILTQLPTLTVTSRLEESDVKELVRY